MSIQVKHLNQIYSQGTAFEQQALKDVNLEIEDGEFIGLIGHTGSGKSTLIQHLNGLIRATDGDILYNGVSIYSEGFKMKELRSKVGLVFQYPEHQLFEADVFSDVCYGPRNQGLSEEEVKERAKEALQAVGFPENFFTQSPFELSGGEKRRVAIAGVIAMDPDVLILDEPTAGLDPRGRDVLLSQIVNYHEVRHNTILLVSHSMEDIAKYADKVLVMSRKKIAMYDTVEKVFARAPELLELGLSVPQVTKIFLKLREMGVDVPADVYTIPYAVKMILAAKARRDAGETLVLPRNDDQKGGAAEC